MHFTNEWEEWLVLDDQNFEEKRNMFVRYDENGKILFEDIQNGTSFNFRELSLLLTYDELSEELTVYEINFEERRR